MDPTQLERDQRWLDCTETKFPPKMSATCCVPKGVGFSTLFATSIIVERAAKHSTKKNALENNEHPVTLLVELYLHLKEQQSPDGWDKTWSWFRACGFKRHPFKVESVSPTDRRDTLTVTKRLRLSPWVRMLHPHRFLRCRIFRP